MPELMWVLLVLAVVVGAGGGWLLSRGRGGAMPALVDDRPQPRLPEGAFTADDLDKVSFARTGQGYDRAAVDDVIAVSRRALLNPDDADPKALVEMTGQAQFAMSRGGYQMQQVDAVLDRLNHQFMLDEMSRRDPVEPSADEPSDAQQAEQAPDAE